MKDQLPTELRHDVLTGRSVIVAVQRSQRPHHVGAPTTSDDVEYDPFAEGSEHDTPSESLALRHVNSQPDQPGWLLRVVPNRYPAVTPSLLDDDFCSSKEGQPGNHSQAACGFHEVVIECPDRRTRFQNLSAVEIARVLLAWQTRFTELSRQPGIAAVHIFRNEGAMAGASLPHCHSQILATHWLDSADPGSSHEEKRTAYDQWLNQELTARDRILEMNDELVVVCPFASRVAFQVRFCPNTVDAKTPLRFGELNHSSLHRLAQKLLRVVKALHCLRGEVSFNLLLKLPPVAHPNAYPWYIDLMPRTGQFAGFELLATDTDIVTTAPETAAADYRDALEPARLGVEESLWSPEYRWV